MQGGRPSDRMISPIGSFSATMRPILLLFAVSIVLTGCSALMINEQDVFYPKPSVTPQSFDLEGVTLSDRSITVADSVDVNAWHLTQDDARATVLFFGGNGFYLVQSRSYLRALTRPPVDALLWDYRGYGRSDGDPGVETFRRDALAVYDYLVEDGGVPPEQIVVWGHSLGSFLATHVATQRSVGGVVLENPATNVDDWVDHLFPWYVRLFLGVDVDPSLRQDNNLERVRDLSVPMLIVGGAADNVTDAAMARRLHEAAGSPHKQLVVVEEGEHNGLHDHPEVQSAYRTLVQRITDVYAPVTDTTAGAAVQDDPS